MTNTDIARLANLVSEYPTADLWPTLLGLIAEGRPVERERIASATGQPAEDVIAGLPDLQWDERGRLVGAGLTLEPTPHRYIVDGRTLYTWCATDALIFPVVLGKPARVESVCPATGTPITVDVLPDRLAGFSPQTAVVSRAMPRGAVPDIRTVSCVHGHFYASERDAGGWRADHPDGSVNPLAEEFALCQAVAKDIGWVS